MVIAIKALRILIMFSSIANGLRLRKRQIPQQLKDKIRLHHGSVFDVAGAPGQGMMFFLTPQKRWDGPLAEKMPIHAGEELRVQADLVINHPKPGQVFDFPGFESGFDKIFIGILAKWDDGIFFEDRELVACYRESILKARSIGLKHIVFPALGKDKTDFPHIKFARLALNGIFEALGDPVERITIACADKRMMDTYKKRLEGN